MKQQPENQQQPSLYLEVCFQNEEPRLPLHTSIVLFLLSYCECKFFKVYLVFKKPSSSESLRSQLPEHLDSSDVQSEALPQLVRDCRLPAVLDETGQLCRAGLAVVLRHIINKTIEADPSRNDVLALLGFKKTCLKACAEVSRWTRLCEIEIPSAVEEHLQNPANDDQQVPLSILTLERRLAEPVRVHNDDKIRRRKLQEQRREESAESQENLDSESEPGQSSQACDGLELRAALAKLSVDSVPALATRENSEIRKVKTADLPPLEHVFAEGLYFTLTDVVLLPCIYQYLCSLQARAAATLHHLPHLLRWYGRVQEVPGVLRAAKACGLLLSIPQAPTSGLPILSAEDNPTSLPVEEEEGREMAPEVPFVGGPRPTMTKLKENGIEAVFTPHPCPSWTLPWESLPGAINPTEGKMSNIRAVRKMQQLNNLVAMVTELARPGYTIVDFCSGTLLTVGIFLSLLKVILIENKEESLVRAQSRSAELGLKNIGFIQANLDYFTGPFHIGVSIARMPTDNATEDCKYAGFPFCFYLTSNCTRFLSLFQEHMILCRFADQTAVQLPPDRRLIGKQCMGLVDLDRSWAAETHGYSVQVMTMEPESCSPKNNMLVGRPLKVGNGAGTSGIVLQAS
uniref:Glutathione S-transferase, C-terminal domain containing n=1 Tax=Haplochromis burtoni TaxID=8153 RepID=A0A3Q2WWP3_HAPBU